MSLSKVQHSYNSWDSRCHTRRSSTGKCTGMNSPPLIRPCEVPPTGQITTSQSPHYSYKDSTMKIGHISKHMKADKVNFASTLITEYKWPIFFAIRVTNILASPNCLKKLNTWWLLYLNRLYTAVQQKQNYKQNTRTA